MPPTHRQNRLSSTSAPRLISVGIVPIAPLLMTTAKPHECAARHAALDFRPPSG
jgi:hypothetical protein